MSACVMCRHINRARDLPFFFKFKPQQKTNKNCGQLDGKKSYRPCCYYVFKLQFLKLLKPAHKSAFLI